MGKLTDREIRAAVKKGDPTTLGDGLHLYLRVTGPNRAKWLFRYTVAAKSHEMGLGPFGSVPLARARELAAESRADLERKVDPIAARRARREPDTSNLTFSEVAERYIAVHRSGWRNAKHAAQWRSTLTAYAFPVIGKVPVAAVTKSHLAAILEPLWAAKKVETGSRLRGRIEAILDFAEAKDWRPEAKNPARWKGNLAHSLPAPGKVRRVQHHPAMDWRELPEFMVLLAEMEGVAPICLRFVILTACRSGEARGAAWSEIDAEARTWTIPEERTKAHRLHRIPLSASALDVVREAEAIRVAPGGLIFLSPARNKPRPLSDATLGAVLRRMGRGEIVPHGFRSSFRDWAADNGKPGDVAEMALAHTLGDKTEAAYNRTDLFARRRLLMDEWAAFVMEAERVRL